MCRCKRLAIAPVHQPIPDGDTVTNTQAIGDVLYTYYLYPFQMAGIILLIAMIGAIVLTHRARPGVRKQSIARQIGAPRAGQL